jgi:tetratricopeptide (TPR) repeat protein
MWHKAAKLNPLNRLESLQKRFALVRAKRTGLVLCLYGEPGIGKTHLLAQLQKNLPFGSWCVHAVLPLTQIALGLPRPNNPPDWIKKQLLACQNHNLPNPNLLLAGLLELQAPFVLCLEDAHELNPEALRELLEFAQIIAKTRGVALVVTSRLELPSPFVGVPIAPLDSGQLKALLMEQGALPEPALTYIQQRAGGNPLFALEYLRHLRRLGALYSDGSRFFWREPDSALAPVGVQVLLEQWLAEFLHHPQSRDLLLARAVLPNGPTVALESWQAVAGVLEKAFAKELQNLQKAQLLRQHEFAHPLLREVLLTLPDKTTFAKRALAVCQDNLAWMLQLLSWAGLEKNDALKWLDQLQVQAPAQQKSLIVGQKVAYLTGQAKGEAALLASQQHQDRNLNQALYFARIAWAELRNHAAAVVLLNALFQSGQAQEAAEFLSIAPPTIRKDHWHLRQLLLERQYDQIVAQYQAHPHWQEELEFGAFLTVVESHIATMRLETALELIEPKLSAPDLEPIQRMNLYNLKAMTLGNLDQHRAALRIYQDLIAHFPEEGVYRLNYASELQYVGAQPTEILQHAQKALELFYAHSKYTSIANVLGLIAHQHQQLGQYELAERGLLEAIAIGERTGSKSGWLQCHFALGELYLVWDTPVAKTLGVHYTRLGIDVAKKTNAKAMHSYLLNCHIACLVQTRQFTRAQQALLELEALVSTISSKGFYADYLRSKGELLMALGAPAQARQALQQALELHNTLEDPNTAQSIRLSLAEIQQDHATLQDLHAWFVEHDLPHAIKRTASLLQTQLTAPEPAPNLRLEVLGRVQMTKDQEPIPYKANKRLEVLVYLLEARVSGRNESSTGELLDALYPELSENEAKGALKQSVFTLRQKFGNTSIISTPRGYRLGALSSDLEAFLLEPKSELWRGVYLSGLEHQFFGTVRAALLEQIAVLVQNLHESNPQEAARLAQIWLEMEPYDPNALLWLLRCKERNPLVARSIYQDAKIRYQEVGENLPPEMQAFMSGERLN